MSVRPVQFDAINGLRQAMVRAGLTPPDEIIADGEIHRFATNGKRGDDAGWYILYTDNIPAGAFGDWRTGLEVTWSGKAEREMSAAERIAFARLVEQGRRRAAEERKRKHDESADKASALWAALEDAPPDHDYLRRKRIAGHPAKLYRGPMGVGGVSCDGSIVIPAYNGLGVLRTVEFILPNGEKRFFPGGEKGGTFCPVGWANATPDVVLMCEGFATGATLHAATGLAVAVAFDAGNLVNAAESVRQMVPNARLVFCADDDRWTEGNPGKTAAHAAGRALGAEVLVPIFKDDASKPTDFNDLAVLEGLEAVKAQVGRAPRAGDARRLSIVEMAAREAEEPPFVLPGWLPARAVTLFSAHGSGGKSQIALHLAICLAAGIAFMGVPVSRRHRVFVYSCEDDEAVLHFRLQRICTSLNVDLASLDGWLLVEDASEAENVLYTGDENPAMRLTYTFSRVERVMREEEVDVLVLDNASDVFAANEINRADVRDFISKLKRLATIRENGAVLLLGHVNRESTKAGSASGQGYSGSTAWHNSVRSRWELRRENENADEGENVPRLLTCVKSNYGPEGHSHAWVWNHIHMTFVPETPRSPLEMKIIQQTEDRQILTALVECIDKRKTDVRKASSGVLTTAAILGQAKHFPKKYARSAAGTIAKLEEMVDAGLVAHDTVKVDRKPKTVYVPTAQGRALIERGAA